MALTMVRILLAVPAIMLTATLHAEPLKSVEEYELNATRKELKARAQFYSDQVKRTNQQLKALSEIDNPRSSSMIRAPYSRVDDSPRVVNGVMTVKHPSTGALLLRDGDGSTFQCTGTIIGCSSFVTAAHCINDDPTPSRYQVYLQHGGLFDVKRVDYQTEKYHFPHADIAVLTLSQPVTGIAPAKLNKGDTLPFGTAGTIVGFGRRGGSDHLYGLKQIGNIRTSDCRHVDSGYLNSLFICWQFDAPIMTPGENSNTCNGDSGGPLFARLRTDPRLLIAGVTSGGRNKTCMPTDKSFDTQISEYAGWVEQICGADLEGQCGTLPRVGSPGTKVKAIDGTMTPDIQQQAYEIVIPENISMLRFAMNGEDDLHGSNDFNLYVSRGIKPTTDMSDCKQDGPGQFAACEFSNPKAGTWHVLIARKKGAGKYQLVSTYFSKPN